MTKKLIKKLSLTPVKSHLTDCPVYAMPDGTLCAYADISANGDGVRSPRFVYFRRQDGIRIASCKASTFFLQDADLAVVERFLLRMDVDLGKIEKMPEFK